MDKQCGIVQDLLPLYVDGVCSEQSSEMIKDHLENCPECSKIYDRMRSTASEDALKRESRGVIVRHTKNENRRLITCILAAVAAIYIPALFVIPLFSWGDGGFITMPYAFDLLVLFLYTVPFWLAFIEFGTVLSGILSRRKMSAGEKVMNAVGILLAAGIVLTIFNLEEFLYLALILTAVLLVNFIVRAVVFRKKLNFLAVFRQKMFWICVVCLVCVIAVIVSAAFFYRDVQRVKEDSLASYSFGVRDYGSEYEGLFFDVSLEEMHAWDLYGENPVICARLVNATDEKIRYDVKCSIYKKTQDGWVLSVDGNVDQPYGFEYVLSEKTRVQDFPVSGWDLRESGLYRLVMYVDGKAVWFEFDLTVN